jgi:hypothetical protein
MVMTQTSKQGETQMKIRDIAADLIGILCIFGLLWAGFVFAHGMGW